MNRLLIPAALIVAMALSACGGARHAAATHPDRPARNHVAAASPDPSTGAGAAKKIEFVVTGATADGVEVIYHAGSHELFGPTQINGKATRVPWQGSVTFDPKLKFYSLEAGLYGPGTVSCKIVVELSDGRVLTAVSGHVSGKFAVCSLRTAPTDKTGLHWTKD